MILNFLNDVDKTYRLKVSFLNYVKQKTNHQLVSTNWYFYKLKNEHNVEIDDELIAQLNDVYDLFLSNSTLEYTHKYIKKIGQSYTLVDKISLNEQFNRSYPFLNDDYYQKLDNYIKTRGYHIISDFSDVYLFMRPEIKVLHESIKTPQEFEQLLKISHAMYENILSVDDDHCLEYNDQTMNFNENKDEYKMFVDWYFHFLKHENNPKLNINLYNKLKDHVNLIQTTQKELKSMEHLMDLYNKIQ